MPKDFNLKAFDSVIMGTGAVYTPPELDAQLALSDFLALQAVVAQATGTSAT